MTIPTSQAAGSAAQNQYVRTILAIASGSALASGGDAAGIAVSGQLDARSARLGAAANNVDDMVSLAQTQQGFLQGVQDSLTRMSVLAQQASSNVFGADAQAAYSAEFDSLKNQIDQVTQNASFNGQPLFSGGAVSTTVNADGTQDGLSLGSLDTGTLGLSGVSLDTPADAQDALSKVNAALSSVTGRSASVSADISKFNFYAANIGTEQNSVLSANSSISDADVAKQSTALASAGIRNQLDMAVRAQANRSAKNVLNLLTSP
ncbi:MAG: flagellin [Verrucomicrobium sp.]|nr:flagellin [Verrucomicrobium sp.]